VYVIFLVTINRGDLVVERYGNKLITKTGCHKKERYFLIKERNILIWS